MVDTAKPCVSHFTAKSHLTADPSDCTTLQLKILRLREVNLFKVKQVITLKVRFQSQI